MLKILDRANMDHFLGIGNLTDGIFIALTSSRMVLGCTYQHIISTVSLN